MPRPASNSNLGRPLPAEASSPSPLALLFRVNALQAWRRVTAIRERSRLLSSLIGFFIVGYVTLAFWLFRVGLEFVITHFPGLGSLLVERLLFLLFAFLFVLLLFSNLVISYTNLFRNRETTFLLSLPVPPQIIFRWKLIESALLLLTGAAFWLKAEQITDDMFETRVLAVLDKLLMKTRFAQFALLPSYWL